MKKVRVGHEDVFNDHGTEAENIAKKYHFDFNHKRAVKSSDTKRISARNINRLSNESEDSSWVCDGQHK
jgi:hypothetical protein